MVAHSKQAYARALILKYKKKYNLKETPPKVLEIRRWYINDEINYGVFFGMVQLAFEKYIEGGKHGN